MNAVASFGDFQDQWFRVCDRLRAEFGEEKFQSWFKPLRLISIGGGRASLAAPTSFMRDFLERHYTDQLVRLWAEENEEIRGVDFLLGGGTASRGQQARPCAKDSPTAGIQAHTRHLVPGRQREAHTSLDIDYSVGAPLDPKYSFENFVVGKSNELAHAAARRVAEAAEVPFNPLFLYGDSGLGKTHLMQAMAWEIKRRYPERKVVYLSAEQFMYHFIQSLRFKTQLAFKQRFRTVDVLMIDDVQFISGKESTQEEFFHTFNSLLDHNRQIIISADRSPSDLDGIEERIRSRFSWGLSADIHPTDYELRLGILQAKAARIMEDGARAPVPHNVLEFLAHKVTSNVRELEGALNKVVVYSELVGRPVNLEMTQEVLRDLIRANDRKLTIEDIQRRVAEYYKVRMSDLLSARRARPIARPRQVAMYLAKSLTTRSLPEIGRKFGGRDHTTVMHAIKRIDELRAHDKALDEDVDLLRRMLES
jgi:chromosomal replication initiator protein